jgi:hypothetical protein
VQQDDAAQAEQVSGWIALALREIHEASSNLKKGAIVCIFFSRMTATVSKAARNSRCNAPSSR